MAVYHKWEKPESLSHCVEQGCSSLVTGLKQVRQNPTLANHYIFRLFALAISQICLIIFSHILLWHSDLCKHHSIIVQLEYGKFSKVLSPFPLFFNIQHLLVFASTLTVLVQGLIFSWLKLYTEQWSFCFIQCILQISSFFFWKHKYDPVAISLKNFKCFFTAFNELKVLEILYEPSFKFISKIIEICVSNWYMYLLVYCSNNHNSKYIEEN